jgi:hypothetical protein
MSVNLRVEPFDVEFLGNYDSGKWDSAGGELTLSFFGTPIWTLDVKEGYIDEYDQDKLKDVAVEILGELISERLNERVKSREYGGISFEQ